MSMVRRIQRLPGMRDIDGRAHDRLREIAGRLRGFLRAQGFGSVDTPVVEETELFVRKSGGELTSRLYTFTDPGGHRVSLRPEFTSSVIRYFVQEHARLALPVRWQYAGPVFRYEHGAPGGYHQFTQLGAEVIGAGGVQADGDLLHLAWAGLKGIGAGGFQVRLGHMRVLNDLLGDFGLSDPAKRFVIGNVQAMKSGLTGGEDLIEQAESVGLVRGGTDGDGEVAADALPPAAVRDFLHAILGEATSGSGGRRTPDQIVARLLRKAGSSDERKKMVDALVLLERLGGLEGPPSAVLDQAQKAVSHLGLSGGHPFDELERLARALSDRGVPEADLVIDFGLGRGIAYYSGVIFELVAASSSGPVRLCGGGRYDGLVKAMGGDDVPALGFAYSLDQVVDAVTGAFVSSVGRSGEGSDGKESRAPSGDS